MSVTRSTTPEPVPGFDDAHRPAEPAVSDADAQMLAEHAILVQGGYSTPDVERQRAVDQLTRSPGSIDFDRMRAEVEEAKAKRLAALDNDVDDAAGQIDVAKVRRYKELRELQKGSEAEVAAYKEEANALEAELVDMFAEAGTQNINLDGKTVYLHRSVFAQRKPGVDLDDLITALREAGAGDLVKDSVNANTLSAWVRELTEDDDAPGLPEAVAEVLEAGERFSVRVIAGGSRAKSKTHSKG